MSEQAPAEREAVRVQRIGGIVAALGFWIFWSPVLVTEVGWTITVTVVLGAAIAISATYNVYRVGGGRGPSLAVSVLIVLFGVAVLAIPFVPQLPVTVPLLFWSNVVAGALVAVLGGYTVYGGRKVTRATPTGA